jgi:chemotaxis protein methyltransferase CheR
MAIEEAGALFRGWDIEILATDFSEEALLAGQRGVYNQFEVQRGLPVTHLIKYFKTVADGWEITPELREKVRFRRQNLMHNSMRHGVFDVVLCRNVLIYFDEVTKRQVLSRLVDQVTPGGYLLLGATESVLGLSDAFGPLESPCPGIYRRLTNEDREARGGFAGLPATGADRGGAQPVVAAAWR